MARSTSTSQAFLARAATKGRADLSASPFGRLPARVGDGGDGRRRAATNETPLTYTRPVRPLTRLAVVFAFFVSTLVGAAGLPSPESVLGFRPGADYKLATYDQSVDYFRKLADATKLMKLAEAGKTSQGRARCLARLRAPKTRQQ